MIKRFDPDAGRAWIQEYEIPIREGMTVLEGLWHIVLFIDGSLSFRYSCRGAVCGSCAMIIDETISLACHTQITSIKSDVIGIEPLPRFRLIKDLVVEMDAFFEKYRSIGPCVVNEEKHEKEHCQSSEERHLIYDSVKCILCASCHAACPLTAVDEDYLGPAVLNGAQRFIFDSRNQGSDGVLNHVNNNVGVQGCRTISRCTEVCPKDIRPSERIKEIKGRIVEYRLEGKIDLETGESK